MSPSPIRTIQTVFAVSLILCPTILGQKSGGSQVDRRKPGYDYSALEPMPTKEEIVVGKGIPSLRIGEGGIKSEVEVKGPPINTVFGVSKRPMVLRLEPLYEKAGVQLPATLSELTKDYSLYLVKLDVHLIRESGEEVQQVAFKGTYLGPDIATVQMFPATEWESRFKVGFNGEVALSPSLEFIPKYVNITKKEATVTVVWNFSYEWKYPVVQSIGLEDDFCQWHFKKRHDLAGDIPLYVIVRAPRLAPSIKMKVGAAFLIKIKRMGTYEYTAFADTELTFPSIPDKKNVEQVPRFN